jgi:hypothetical protein
VVTASVQVFVLGMERAQGWGSNPIPSSTAVLLLGFVSLMGYMLVKDVRRNVFLLGPVFGIATVFLASSRGPLLAVPVLIIVALVMVRIRATVIAMAGLLAAAASALYFVIKPETFERFRAILVAGGDLLPVPPARMIPFRAI